MIPFSFNAKIVSMAIRPFFINRTSRIYNTSRICAYSSNVSQSSPEKHGIDQPKHISRLQAVIDFIPGRDLKRKTAFLTISSAITSILISSDIYIVNNESPLLLTFLIVMRFLYLKAGPIIREFIENEENKNVQEIQDAFQRRKNALVAKVEHLMSFKETNNFFNDYLRTKKENVHLEIELESLVQEIRQLQEIKLKLDDMCRKIAEQKASQKKNIIEETRNRIFETLKGSEKQNAILAHCLARLDAIQPSKS